MVVFELGGGAGEEEGSGGRPRLDDRLHRPGTFPVRALRLHPDRLDDLEDGRTDDDEEEERDQLWRHGVAVVLLGRLAHVAALRDVLGVLLVGLSHTRRGRHRGR